VGLLLSGLAQAQQAAPSQAPPGPWTVPATPLPPSTTGSSWQGVQSNLTTVTPAQVIQQTALLQRGTMDSRVSSEEAAIQDIAIQLSPPSPDRLFKLESERMWRERLRQEARQRVPPDRIVFPEEVVLTTETYQPHCWPTMVMSAEPNWVGYEKLLFEQKNAERYGWDLGPIHPILSAAVFLGDFITLPYNLASDPLRCYEFNSGYPLPGDPTPFRLYPFDINLTGAVGQTAAVLAVLAIFP
jgi:hypothetical protein